MAQMDGILIFSKKHLPKGRWIGYKMILGKRIENLRCIFIKRKTWTKYWWDSMKPGCTLSTVLVLVMIRLATTNLAFYEY